MEVLNSLFEFKDGVLYNKPDRPYPAKAGQPVGYENLSYQFVDVKRQKYAVHRIAFYMQHGWVPDYIDHINGITDDNRLINLRDVATAENCQHQRKTRSDSTSGLMGALFSFMVCFLPSRVYVVSFFVAPTSFLTAATNEADMLQ